MDGFKVIAENMWSWSVYSEQKALDFNGTALFGSGGAVLIDPVSLDEAQSRALKERAPLLAVLLTNKDHERASQKIAEDHHIPVWIHEEDASLLQRKPDQTFTHYDRLPLGIVAIHLSAMKSPGECAFFWKNGTADGVMILGDALIGKPAGEMCLLPPAKVSDPAAAVQALRALLQFNFEGLILGDGPGFASGGKAKLTETLTQLARASA